MKRFIVLLMVLAMGSMLTSAAMAATAPTIDIASYMGLTPGNWELYQNSDGSLQLSSVVNGTSGQIVQDWYDYNGSAWVFDSSDTFTVTDSTVQRISTNDGTYTWTFSPAMVLPRQMAFNKPYEYVGIITNQTTNQHRIEVFSFVITKGNLTVSTPAGVFSNCIKAQAYEYSSGTARASVSLYAPGESELKTWVSKIEDTSTPVNENQEAWTGRLIQFGVRALLLP